MKYSFILLLILFLTNISAQDLVIPLWDNKTPNYKECGENVPSNIDLELYENKYVDFVNQFKTGNNAITMCTTPFFPDDNGSKVSRKVALRSNSFLVDLASLVLLDEENYAKNEKEYPGNSNAWKVDGIGIHPGDYGMENIANVIFIYINAVIKN